MIRIGIATSALLLAGSAAFAADQPSDEANAQHHMPMAGAQTQCPQTGQAMAMHHDGQHMDHSGAAQHMDGNHSMHSGQHMSADQTGHEGQQIPHGQMAHGNPPMSCDHPMPNGQMNHQAMANMHGCMNPAGQADGETAGDSDASN